MTFKVTQIMLAHFSCAENWLTLLPNIAHLYRHQSNKIITNVQVLMLWLIGVHHMVYRSCWDGLPYLVDKTGWFGKKSYTINFTIFTDLEYHFNKKLYKFKFIVIKKCQLLLKYLLSEHNHPQKIHKFLKIYMKSPSFSTVLSSNISLARK